MRHDVGFQRENGDPIVRGQNTGVGPTLSLKSGVQTWAEKPTEKEMDRKNKCRKLYRMQGLPLAKPNV